MKILSLIMADLYMVYSFYIACTDHKNGSEDVWLLASKKVFYCEILHGAILLPLTALVIMKVKKALDRCSEVLIMMYLLSLAL